MSNHKQIKLVNKPGVKMIPLTKIPAKDIRVARNALAEDIVIAEIAIADNNIQAGSDTARLIAKIRNDIGSLEHIDTFLKEIGHE